MKKLCLSMIALVGAATPALAQNEGPPPGALFSLTGQTTTNNFRQYSFSFVATLTNTVLTFAMRDDLGFIYLDNVMMKTGGGANLVTNGSFETSTLNTHLATGWTYSISALADPTYAGFVTNSDSQAGRRSWADGASPAYDAISQSIATDVGSTYTVSFYAHESRSVDTYRPIATADGAAADLFVYAQADIPVFGQVPEPASWAMMVAGFGLAGAALRRRRSGFAVA